MNIAIIGNGIAGSTAALRIAHNSSHTVQLISSESNIFFSRTALMYIFMGHMRLKDTHPFPDEHWDSLKINRITDYVESIDFQGKKLFLKENPDLKYDVLILATGSNYNKFGWPGQDLEGVRGLYHLQDLEYLEKKAASIQRAVIVGGGLIGIELAEMLHSRHIPVTLLVREASFWDNALPAEESAMVSRHIREYGFDLRLSTNLNAIVDDGRGHVKAVQTDKGEEIECQYVGLTAGVHPNISLVQNTPIETDRGILVDALLQTNMPDVYAVGDCVQLREPRPGRRSIEPLWYTGRMMGESVAATICGQPTEYDPGIWFNSAKFLDIEYQVYGDVPNQPREGLASLYWEHPNGKKSIRINYDAAYGIVTGFNLMGIRYRQVICEKWIREKATVEDVLKQLSLANFDPEFYPEHEKDLLDTYSQMTGRTIKRNASRSWDQALSFLRKK